jgi:diguanylate cyclase (GGDEF)-like protein
MTSTESRSTPLILIATTDSHTSHFVRETLEQAGFAAEVVGTRSAFLHALERRSPDLALVDGRTAGGFEWCGAVPRKAEPQDEHGLATPVVMLCDPNEVARVREIGAIDFILHPLSKDLLLHRVRHTLHVLHTEQDLETHQRALASTQRLAGVGTWEIALATDVIDCSEEARRIFGWSDCAPTTRKKSDLVALVDENHGDQLRDWLDRAGRQATFAPIECRIPRAKTEHSGSRRDPTELSERVVRLHVDRVESHEGRPTRVCGLVHDITDARAAEDHGTGATELDGVAGLPNMPQFLERVARVMGNAQPPHDQVAVLYISLGLDQALRDPSSQREPCLATLVQRMKACIRDRDTLCHVGNRARDLSLAHVSEDEFTVLLPGFLRAQDAYKVARRIQDCISQPIAIDDASVTVQACLGIAIYPIDSLSPETLLKASESAMRQAREQGDHRVQFFTASMNASAFERMTLETDLRKAIEREELLVYYQPKIELASGNIVGVEALLRWQHPEFGMVSPAQFIPIAEETGLIIPIGEYVLRVACAQNKRWQDQGLAPIRMAVNLSTVQFRDPELHKMVTRTLRATGLAPDHLELELTESVLLQRADTTIATLHSLKKMGVHLAIDDFGTGYSSLSYLKRFPIDSLKIDQSFIRELTTNPEDAAITTSIILMGRSLKLKVVAEGVESPSQLAFLKVLECDEAQGYLFSRPVPADEVARLFSTSFATSTLR